MMDSFERLKDLVVLGNDSYVAGRRDAKAELARRLLQAKSADLSSLDQLERYIAIVRDFVR